MEKEMNKLLDDDELKSISNRLDLEHENDHMSTEAFEYMTLFDNIMEDGPSDVVERNFIETRDVTISEMRKVVYSLDGLPIRFNYLSQTLPMSTNRHDISLHTDIHIIRNISSHLNATVTMDQIPKGATEGLWTPHVLAYIFLTTFSYITSVKYLSWEYVISTKTNPREADGVVELFEKPNQIPLFILEVSNKSSDPGRFKEERRTLMKEGIFALNKFIARAEFPTWKVCKTLGVFLSRGFGELFQTSRYDTFLYFLSLTYYYYYRG
ncbi:2541_t:CDS:1 [Acaulospora colombiana]|uniref:2541_t:CDS:1 n=1 Tax=Acaulospora colombiana TaxID=27376 RepID=A0ACA9K6Y4_9GLOM|nr:2541_t:CDS:1 [Acaulospora colombiana]